MDLLLRTEAFEVFAFRHLYFSLIKDELSELFWFVPDQSNRLLLNRLSLPFFVVELRSSAIELFKIVEFNDIIGGVVDVICLIFEIHGVRVINLLHQFDQL